MINQKTNKRKDRYINPKWIVGTNKWLVESRDRNYIEGLPGYGDYFKRYEPIFYMSGVYLNTKKTNNDVLRYRIFTLVLEFCSPSFISEYFNQYLLIDGYFNFTPPQRSESFEHLVSEVELIRKILDKCGDEGCDLLNAIFLNYPEIKLYL